MKEYLATFFTHSGAVKYNRHIKKLGFKATSMPVPRKVSSNCGIAVRFECDIDVSTIISEDIEQLYSVSGKSDYVKIYETE